MFSSKPVQPVVRTTDPELLRQKAIEFLDKNYTTYVMPSEGFLKEVFYMLEPKSINGMKRISNLSKTKPEYYRDGSVEIKDPIIAYNILNSNGKVEKISQRQWGWWKIKPSQGLWYRSGMSMGDSAIDAVLGGRKSRRKSRRRQRKSYRR